MRKDLIYRKVELYGLKIIRYPMDANKGFYVEVDGQKYIAVNDKLNDDETFFVIAHEVSHIDLDNRYKLELGQYRIAMCERETNERMILQLGIPSNVLNLKCKGLTNEEIKKELHLPNDVFEIVRQYLLRRLLIPNGKSSKRTMLKRWN